MHWMCIDCDVAEECISVSALYSVKKIVRLDYRARQMLWIVENLWRKLLTLLAARQGVNE